MASNIPDDGKTCTICFETYSKPKCLECGHSFCETCIHKYVMKCKEKGTLGNGIECRKVNSSPCDPNRPDTWAKSLSSNFALVDLLAASVGSEVCKDTEDRVNNSEFSFFCQPCFDQGNHLIASVFCIDCIQYQCVECANLHKKFDAIKCHEIIAIDGQEEKIKFLISVKQMQLCDKHREKKVYICSSENQLCCSTCIFEKHKQCKTVKIENAVETLSLEDIKQSLKVLNVKVKSATKFWCTREKYMESQAEPIRRDIETKRKNVMKMFDTLEQRTIVYLEAASKERIPEFDNNRKSCEKVTANINETLNLCNSAVKYGTPQQKNLVARKLEETLSCYQTNSDEEFSKLKSTMVLINYLTIGEQIENECKELGSPFLYSEKISVNAIPDYRESSLELKSCTKLTTDSWYRSIDFLSDGRLIAVDQFSNELLLFDKELKCISRYKFVVHPFSVKTFGSNDEIVVTSGESRQLFYFEVKADILHLVRSMKIKVTCDTIAPIDEESFIVGLFRGKRPIGVVSFNGEEKNISFDLPEKTYTAENSKCAFNSKSNILAISDKNMDKVLIVDGKSYKIVHILSESILHPRGIVFGPNDTLFICSGATDSIVQATTEGRVLMSHKLNVLHPYAICISQDKRQLAVANLEINDKQLQVFDIFSA